MFQKNKIEEILHKLKNLRKDQLLIMLLCGILLLVIAIPTQKNENLEEENEQIFQDTQTASSDTSYVARTKRQLEEVLSQIENAGDVTVMLTLASSSEQIIEKDRQEDQEQITETDSQGGARTTQNSAKEETTVYNNADSDAQVPYVTKEIMPRVEGVVVVAEGGDNSVVVKNITEVIQALFGIETHKIKIVKKS